MNNEISKFINNLSCSDPTCRFLDKLGVPRAPKWRALIMYMRSIKDYDFLTDKQKEQIQQLVLEVLQTRDFSDQKFQEIIRKQEIIISARYNKKIEAAFKATTELVKEFKSLLLKRSGDVNNLEDVTVETILTGEEPEQIIRKIKNEFREIISVMRQDAENLVQLSRTDALTKINNRGAFDQFIEKAVNEARSQNKPLSLILFDIDYFKKFNDKYGHRIGDQALIAVASIVKKYVQEIKAQQSKSLFPARYGGEEFVLVLPDIALNMAVPLAEELRKRIEDYNFVIRNTRGQIVDKSIKITISLGVAELLNEWESSLVDNLIDAADQALYTAKKSGRNRVCYYTLKGCKCE